MKESKFLRQEMSQPEADSNRMLLPFELSGPDICCPVFFNTGSGGIDIFK